MNMVLSYLYHLSSEQVRNGSHLWSNFDVPRNVNLITGEKGVDFKSKYYKRELTIGAKWTVTHYSIEIPFLVFLSFLQRTCPKITTLFSLPFASFSLRNKSWASSSLGDPWSDFSGGLIIHNCPWKAILNLDAFHLGLDESASRVLLSICSFICPSFFPPCSYFCHSLTTLDCHRLLTYLTPKTRTS